MENLCMSGRALHRPAPALHTSLCTCSSRQGIWLKSEVQMNEVFAQGQVDEIRWESLGYLLNLDPLFSLREEWMGCNLIGVGSSS